MTGRRLVQTKHPGIYTRDGRYVIRYRDPSGAQRQKTTATLKEARALRASLVTDIKRGEYRELSPVTVEEYARTLYGTAEADGTYQGRTTNGIRAHTVRKYRRDLELYALPAFGRRRLVDVTPRDVKALITEMFDQGRSPATVRNAIAPVRALFAEAIGEHLIRWNPASGVRVTGGASLADRPKVKALTPDELEAVLVHSDGWAWLVIRFLADTGLRIGELTALRWENVDLGGRVVKVRERFYKGTLDAPKSRFGVRDVPLAPDLARQLAAHRLASAHSAAGDLVFCRLDGSPWNDKSLGRVTIKPAARAAGLVDEAGRVWPAFHTLRHTCASRLFRAGVDVKRVQVILGHHSPAFTLATYVHLIPGDIADVSFFDRDTARG